LGWAYYLNAEGLASLDWNMTAIFSARHLASSAFPPATERIISLIWGMTMPTILEGFLEDRSLFDERNFVARAEAIEWLEEELAFGGSGSGAVADFKSALEAVDHRLFARLRAEIAAGGHRGYAFRELLSEYCPTVVTEGEEYDALDIFVNHLCSYLPMPAPALVLEAEMVDFHKTPARVVPYVARWVGPDDVFVDLGAGLGQVVLLAHLLTGAVARGLEIEPAFCEYARVCATGLGLTAVSFIEGDARVALYDSGTVFFMYTPFTGELLDIVFGLLQRESESRPFTVVTYGPITTAAARQSWLRPVDSIHGLCVFRAG
jgi:Histone methylation protein DOT1